MPFVSSAAPPQKRAMAGPLFRETLQGCVRPLAPGEAEKRTELGRNTSCKGARRWSRKLSLFLMEMGLTTERKRANKPESGSLGVGEAFHLLFLFLAAFVLCSHP